MNLPSLRLFRTTVLAALHCIVGCQSPEHPLTQVGNEELAKREERSDTTFMIGEVVAGNIQTKVVQNVTPTSIRDEFDSVQWSPGTEITIQTKTEVIAIARKESGELWAKWSRDLGNDNFRFSSCDPISKEQAVGLVLSLNARDGKPTTLVNWKDDQ